MTGAKWAAEFPKLVSKGREFVLTDCVNCGKQVFYQPETADPRCLFCGKSAKRKEETMKVPLKLDTEIKTSEQKAEIAREAQAAGIQETAEKYGITWTTVRAWVGRYCRKAEEKRAEDPLPSQETLPAEAPAPPKEEKLSPVPLRPLAPWAISKYYSANAPQILAEIEVLGEDFVKARWDFSAKSWESFRREFIEKLPRPERKKPVKKSVKNNPEKANKPAEAAENMTKNMPEKAKPEAENTQGLWEMTPLERYVAQQITDEENALNYLLKIISLNSTDIARRKREWAEKVNTRLGIKGNFVADCNTGIIRRAQ